MVASLINRAIPFLILPVLTRYLNPYEYGVLAIYQVMILFVSPLVDFNISQNIIRSYFKKSKSELAEYLSNIFLILFSSFSIIIVIISILLMFFQEFFGVPGKWIIVLPLIAFMNMVNKCNLVIFIQENKPFRLSIFEMAYVIINILVSLLLIIQYDFGWEGRATGILISSITMGIVSLLYMRKKKLLKFKIQMDSIKEILKISLPLIPHMIGLVLINITDRIFIDRMIGKELVGIYEVGFKFGMITLLFADAFIRSWSPWFYKYLNSPNPDKLLIVKYSYYFIIGIFIVSFGVTFGTNLIFDFMVDPQFSDSKMFIVWISSGYAVRGIYQIMLLYLIHTGQTKFLAINTLFAAILNMIFNYYMINANGAIGAAQATLIAYFVMSCGCWWYANKSFKMPWFNFKWITAKR